MPNWTAITAALADAGQEVRAGAAPTPVGGGDISAAWRLETTSGAVFLKTGPGSSFDMFSAEAEGLDALAGPGAVRVPGVVACGTTGDSAFVALEWLNLGSPTRDAETRLGEQLAALRAAPKIDSWCLQSLTSSPSYRQLTSAI